MSNHQSDFGYAVTGINPPDTAPIIERYAGFQVRQCEDGFYWQEGGYFDTIEECRADIMDWVDSGVDDDINPHEDTPALDAPWWEYR